MRKVYLLEMSVYSKDEVFAMEPVAEIDSEPIRQLEGIDFKNYIFDVISKTSNTISKQDISTIYSHHCTGNALRKAAMLALPEVMKQNLVICPWRIGKNKKQKSGMIGAPILIDGVKYLCGITMLMNLNKRITPYAITVFENLEEKKQQQKRANGNIYVHHSNSGDSSFGETTFPKATTSQDANLPNKSLTEIKNLDYVIDNVIQEYCVAPFSRKRRLILEKEEKRNKLLGKCLKSLFCGPEDNGWDATFYVYNEIRLSKKEWIGLYKSYKAYAKQKQWEKSNPSMYGFTIWRKDIDRFFCHLGKQPPYTNYFNIFFED